MFDSAVENAIILKNPVTKSVKLPKPVEKNTKVLTVDEQEKFMEEARYSSNYPQYFFILQTGVRTGEMVGLKWEDIDFEKNLISIRRSMCIEAGMRPKTLQQILGHSSINITMNLYVHVTDEEKTKEMHKFEEYSIKMA